MEFALKLRKKHGNPSVMVAARTAQADTVQYRNSEQYNTQKDQFHRRMNLQLNVNVVEIL
jgi:hypothetical protein